ncbi:MAG: DUF922 domain-containing Zn-dependent protease [Candidatus Adiutrix sp.]|jgi:predicted secreted Zn-dependent protease|nr:DUF922 domain-containing Zn-dependent protease [Candidatus Adiutrix sp.]
MKIPVIGNVLGLLILSCIVAAPAMAEVQPEISYDYFPVPFLKGKTAKAMISLSTPLRSENGYRVVGRANWRINFEELMVTRPSIDVCQVAEPRVVCTCKITLPQLQGGDAKTQQEFRQVAEDTRIHEMEHCRLAARYATQLEQAFLALKPRDCDELGQALIELYKKIIDDCRVAQKRFDYDEYGYEQYLDLQSADQPLPRLNRRRNTPEIQVVVPQSPEELQQEGIYKDENGVWRNY